MHTWSNARIYVRLAGLAAVTLLGVLATSCGSARRAPAPAPAEPTAQPEPTVEDTEPRFQPTPLVHIEGGTFMMGFTLGTFRELPEHEVTVEAFAIEEHEVTAAQYNACVAAGACSAPGRTGNFEGLEVKEDTQTLLNLACTGHDPSRKHHPITCVDWHQASAYCAWIGRRLPTEEEWEFAARGEEGRTFVWGDDESLDQGGANTCEQSCQAFAESMNLFKAGAPHVRDGYSLTAPPKQFPDDRTPEGVYDLAGNVTEWTASPFCLYSEPDCETEMKAIRGASWFMAGAGSAARRDPVEPGLTLGSFGFRCAANVQGKM